MRNHQKLFLLVLCTPLAAATCFMEPVDTGATSRVRDFDPNNVNNLSTVILPGDRDVFTDLDETMAALSFLKATPAIDAKRIAIVGHSFGGQLTLLAAERDNAVRAAVTFGGPPTRGIARLNCASGFELQ